MPHQNRSGLGLESLVRQLAMDERDEPEVDSGLGFEWTHQLRQRALALYSAGRWQGCIDQIMGIAASGRSEPLDLQLLTAAYEKLGAGEAARLCRERGDSILRRIESDCAGLI